MLRRNTNTVKLTKAYIESKVSQEAIMSKYLDIPIEVIDDCINKNHLIKSVFRDDDVYGSMGFAYNKKGRLKVRDFGGFGFFEDCYGTVAYVLSLVYERRIDTNNKQDFYFVLKHIAATFSDIFNGKVVDPRIEDSIKYGVRKSRNTKAIIEIVPRSWNKQDKEVWAKFGVELNYLNTHFVIPVEQYYINRNANDDPKYYYKSSDPCYAYMLGQNSNGIFLIKLYFPLRNRATELKFITNCNVLEGLLNLELYNYDYILITKSSKDRLSIGNHLVHHPLYRGAETLNIGVINLPSENYRLNQTEFDWLTNHLADNGMIFSLLDFDRTGRDGAKYLYDTYGIPYLFITRGEFGLSNLDCKDFAELCAKYTPTEINSFINDTFKYINYKYRNEKSTNSDTYYKRVSDGELPY